MKIHEYSRLYKEITRDILIEIKLQSWQRLLYFVNKSHSFPDSNSNI